MFGIGGPELFVILIIALLFVGPDKLPQVAKTVGTGLRDLRRMANLTQNELQSAMNDLAREVERLPEAKAKAELRGKLAALPTQAGAQDDGLDKPPPPSAATTPSALLPADGETLSVVAKRNSPPLEEERAPGPPAAPRYVVKPADGARERMGSWPVHPDAATDASPQADETPADEVPPA